MTWPLFAVIQLVMLTIGISAAFVLRNRSLKASYLELQAGLEAAEIAVAQAKTRSSEGVEKTWLRDRIAELPAEGDIAAVQRLVLENELDASEGFSKNLTEILSSAETAKQAVSEQWASTRQSAAELAAELINRYPLSHPVISQLHEVYTSLDEALNTPIPELPDAPELSEEDSTDITQEAEHLRATNDLLQQELDKLRSELSQHNADGEHADEQAEDLKGLLQQFTKDSRDMMSCIQKLEAENANLRQQLGLGGGDAAAPGEVMTEDPVRAEQDVDPDADRAEESAA